MDARIGSIGRSLVGRGLATLLTVTVLLTVAGEAVAQRGGAGARRDQRIDRVLERHADRLGLDKPTRRQIREISLAGRKKIRTHREEAQRLREQMHALLAEDVPDEDAVLALADQIGRAELAIQKQHLRTILDVRGLLDAGQRAELARIHDEMQAESGGAAPATAGSEPATAGSEPATAGSEPATEPGSPAS